MTFEETEQGRMSIWDKCLTAALNQGKSVEEAIQWAERGCNAFETRFHNMVKAVENAVDNHTS